MDNLNRINRNARTRRPDNLSFKKMLLRSEIRKNLKAGDTYVINGVTFRQEAVI